MPAAAGDIARTSGIEVISRGVKGAQNIAVGDLIAFDANGYAAQAATTDSRDDGFGVALEAQNNTSGADGDLKLRIAIGNTWVYVKAGGAIKPNNLVKVNNATTVVAHNEPTSVTPPGSTDVNNARDYFGLTFGRYICHQSEEQEATDAANTDVICVRLGV